MRRSLVLVVVLWGCTSSSTTAPESTVSTMSTTSSTSTPSTTAGVDPAVERWREDMDALAAGVRRVHPNPFWRQPEAEFDAALVAAPERLAPLDPSDAAAEVMRLAAQIDGHTGVYPADAGFHLYALHLYDFDGRIYVVAAADPTWVGSEVVTIGATPIDDAIAAVTPYGAHDNASTVRAVVPMLLMTPEVLHAAGVVADATAPQYELRTPSGATRVVDPEQLTWATFAQQISPVPVGLPKIEAMPTLARRDEPFWWTELAAGTVLYLQYNQVARNSGATRVFDLAEQMRTALEGGTIERVIVDVRHNPGGDFRTYTPLMDLLTSNDITTTRGGLVVIIGRQTFSAAMSFVAELEQRVDPIFVGEPTGGRPSLYADVRAVQLPNSGVTVWVSSRFWEFAGPGDDREWIEPDLPASLSIDDLVTARDPVLEAAIAASDQ